MYRVAVISVHPNSRSNHGSQLPCPAMRLHSVSRAPISITSATTRLPSRRISAECSARLLLARSRAGDICFTCLPFSCGPLDALQVSLERLLRGHLAEDAVALHFVHGAGGNADVNGDVPLLAGAVDSRDRLL